jgi:hypothetical protein
LEEIMQAKPETRQERITRIATVTFIAAFLGVMGWIKSGGDFSNLL